MKQPLDSKGVRLIAIGYDKDGLAEFQAGKFFSGGNSQKLIFFVDIILLIWLIVFLILELYLDEERKTYESLQFGRVGMFSGFMSLFSNDGKQLRQKVKVLKVLFIYI